MRIRLFPVFVFSLALHASSPPPVILIDGWYPSCGKAPRISTSTFGQLEAKLDAIGISTRYFRPCSVAPQPGFTRASIEELGQALGKLIEQTTQQTGASQVDVIAFSMGSPTVRAYLSGKQNTSGLFRPPVDHKIRKAVFLGGLFFGVGNGHAPVPDIQDDELCAGTPFQWDLNTWNQGAGDLRGIDAIAVAGTGQGTEVGSSSSEGDGVASLSTASLLFAYPAERTRIIEACHVSEVCEPTVSLVDSDSHSTWRIVKSFLTGTDEWKTVGTSPDRIASQSVRGGIFVAVKDANDNLIDTTAVSLGGLSLDRDIKSGPGLFYFDDVAKRDYTLHASAGIPVPDTSFTPTPGTYSVVTMKPGPVISWLAPSGSKQRQPSIPVGSAIDIHGTRLSTGGATTAAAPFPVTLSGTRVTINDEPIPLMSVSDSQITGRLLPAMTGFVRLKVITDEGSHGFNMFLQGTSDVTPPRIAASGVVNAASFTHGAVAPGEFVTILGSNLGPATPITAVGYQKGLGGTKVTFAGIEAFMTYSSSTQVNALVPYGVTGNADAIVEFVGAKSDVFPLSVADSAPGIFTQSYGPGQAWALNDDGTFNGPDNKVSRGGWIVFWATGQGLVNPVGEDGEIITTPKNVNLPVKVEIDGIEAPLIYAVLVYTGEVQVAARVPTGSRTGDVLLSLSIGGASSRNDVTVSLK